VDLNNQHDFIDVDLDAPMLDVSPILCDSSKAVASKFVDGS
jgi:hypothetical protein